MPFTNIDNPEFYPESELGVNNCPPFYYNETKKYGDLAHTTASGPNKHINYFNERKCPIYVHHIRNDSSVYSNYHAKLLAPRKVTDTRKIAPQNASKFVLDKLEETYWATWKPKRESESVTKSRTPRRVQNFIFSDSKPTFLEHNKVPNKEHSNRPHGDVNDNLVKYFKAKDFNSGSTTDSIAHEANNDFKKSNNNSDDNKQSTNGDIAQNKPVKSRPKDSRIKIIKQVSTSQEIQTEVHCPVILKDVTQTEEKSMDIKSEKNTPNESIDKVQEWNERNAAEKEITSKRKVKDKKKLTKQSKKDITKQELPVISESNDNNDSITTFVEHKDSIEITKKKQENSGPKEHFKQPKCIRLFRKSGLAAGYIKGGTYPLKSCLKNDRPKGNFKLGAPGSTLFVTTSSFSNKRRK